VTGLQEIKNEDFATRLTIANTFTVSIVVAVWFAHTHAVETYLATNTLLIRTRRIFDTDGATYQGNLNRSNLLNGPTRYIIANSYQTTNEARAKSAYYGRLYAFIEALRLNKPLEQTFLNW